MLVRLKYGDNKNHLGNFFFHLNRRRKTSLPIQPSSVLRFVYHLCRPACVALLRGIFNGNVNKIDEFQMFSRWIMLLFHYLHQFKEEKKFSHLNSICIYTDRIRMIWFWRCKIFHKYSFNHFCFVFLLLFCSWNFLMCGSFLAWKPPGPIYIYYYIWQYKANYYPHFNGKKYCAVCQLWKLVLFERVLDSSIWLLCSMFNASWESSILVTLRFIQLACVCVAQKFNFANRNCKMTAKPQTINSVRTFGTFIIVRDIERALISIGH